VAAARWGRRAAVFASIAAAAGLAVVVTSSLRRNGAEHSAEEVAPIQVRAPGATVPSSLDDALGVRGKAAAPETNAAGAAKSATPQKSAVPQPQKRAVPQTAEEGRTADEECCGAKEEERCIADEECRAGDRERRTCGEARGAIRRGRPAPAALPEEPMRNEVAMPADARTAKMAEQDQQAAVAPKHKDQLAKNDEQGRFFWKAAESPDASAACRGRRSAVCRGRRCRTIGQTATALGESGPARGPGRCRQAARRVRARAALYRDASALRKQLSPARAAWDLAHAVECLAAGGQVDEAVAARKELLRSFPDHAGPKAAADSALRSVRLPPDEEKK